MAGWQGEHKILEDRAYLELHELETSHWWYRGMRQITDRMLAPYLRGRSNLTFLDVGCGAGGNLTHFLPYGTPTGIDFSPLAIQYAATRFRRIARADAQQIPFAKNSFDLVTSFDVIVMIEDDFRAVQEMARVLRPGGILLLRVAALPALEGPHDIVVRSLRRYTRPLLRQRLDSAGLQTIRMSYANSFLLPLIFGIRKWQNWQLKRGAALPESDVNPVSEPANSLLAGLLGLEARWIGRGQSFPAGVSLFALAQKPAE